MGKNIQLFGPTYYKGIDRYDVCSSFEEVSTRIAPTEQVVYTMLGIGKLRMIYEFAVTVNACNTPGDVAEAGVWNGGCLYLMAATLRNKVCHGFDTWEGLPPLSSEDFVDGKSIVYTGWGKAPIPTWIKTELGDRVKLYKGLFSDTLNDVKDSKFCLVHIDCDLYLSVKECIEFFVPRMSEGGFIIVDDYSFYHCPGAKKAVDEYFDNHGHNYKRAMAGHTVAFSF